MLAFKFKILYKHQSYYAIVIAEGWRSVYGNHMVYYLREQAG